MSITMAVIDFLPVILFAVSGIMLMQDFYNKMSKGIFALFSAGTLITMCAGFCKALYKLLNGAGICDFKVLSDIQFPLQGIGFLMAGIGALAMLYFRKKNIDTYSVVPLAITGSFIFIVFMLLGLSFLYYVLCVLSIKLKKIMPIIIFVFSYIASLCMGYLTSHDFTLIHINWTAQGVNIVAQGLLLAGVSLLRKAGLRDLVLNNEKM